MKNILRSEALKIKGGGRRNIVITVPIITIFITLLTAGANIFESFAIYWWEAIFLFTVFGLLFLYDRKSEEKAGNFQNVRLGELSYRVKLAKIILISWQALLSCMLFVSLLFIMLFLFSTFTFTSIVKNTVLLFLLLFASLWNIPVLYYFSKWINAYLILAINSLTCLLIAPFIAQSPFWYIFPYTYHYKIAHELIGLKPSGDLSVLPTTINYAVIIIALILSVIITGIGIYFLKRED